LNVESSWAKAQEKQKTAISVLTILIDMAKLLQSPLNNIMRLS
jgi:hypothetical protein